MKRDFYESPKPNKITKFLWYAAGADENILQNCTYSDQVKYSCLGGIVLSTGVMAALAGGYAFYTIFGTRGDALDDTLNFPVAFVSMFFGCIWGTIIFNIDRFIVTSTGTGDGTEKITWDEFKSAIPRIIMGMILAITISKPVEIRMFKTEIQVKLKEKQIEQQTLFIEKTKKNFQIELDRNAKDLTKYEKEIEDKIARHKFLEKQYIEEARIITVGPRAIALKTQMDAVAKEIQEDKQNIDYKKLISEKEDIQNRLDTALSNSKQIADNLNGLLERIKISHEIAGFWISLFITLMFMAIELTPIFFKLMLIKSPYDFVSENIKELVKAENGIEVKHNYYQDKEGIEKDLVIQHKVLQKNILLNAQKELSEYAVQKWMEKQKLKIDENPEAFVNNSEPDKTVE